MINTLADQLPDLRNALMALNDRLLGSIAGHPRTLLPSGLQGLIFHQGRTAGPGEGSALVRPWPLLTA